ncbi:hypothetical protein G7046_g5404 [Stylonectria norvegica]|nr:hypothetical protein G7046_g5404 [Stylonectria norvegica]
MTAKTTPAETATAETSTALTTTTETSTAETATTETDPVDLGIEVEQDIPKHVIELANLETALDELYGVGGWNIKSGFSSRFGATYTVKTYQIDPFCLLDKLQEMGVATAVKTILDQQRWSPGEK